MWDKLKYSLRKVDGFFLLIGVLSVIILYLTKSNDLKFYSLTVLLASVIFFLLSQRSKIDELSSGSETFFKYFRKEFSEEEKMKKIVFDDLQAEKGGKFVVTEVYDESQINKPSKPTINAPKEKAMENTLPKSKQKSENIQPEFNIADFFDLNFDLSKNSPDPRSEFDYLLNKILSVIKEVTFAHTVAFFWANREKQQMVCEEKVTNSQNFFTTRKFPIGHDIVSKIALQSKPEIISRVNPTSEAELFLYYTEPQFIKSFVGVPVFFKSQATENPIEEAVAVIAIDSKTEEAFGYETLLLLGQFTKLISGIIKSYTDKYDLLLDAELLNAIHRLQEKIKTDLKPSTVANALIEESAKLLKWDFISIVMQDEIKQTWIVDKVRNRNNEIYIHSGTYIDFDESLLGKVIKSNTHELVENLDTFTGCRYFQNEKINSQGSFVAIPISSINKCYGALCVENKDKYSFSKQDIEVLYRLAENAASALEIYYMSKLIDEYVIVDELTGVYSQKFWLEKFNDELTRSEDFAEDLSLIIISIDKTQELIDRYEQAGLNQLLVTLSRVIRTSVRPYDLVGRLDQNRFGVVLVKTPANEAYLWAEKIRKIITGMVITIDTKSFFITVSMGVCGAIQGSTQEELIKNANLVLQKAIDSGGNTIRVF